MLGIDPMKTHTVLALVGSLRKASLNRAMLIMAETCAPPGLRVEVHPSLGDLPLFNPDLETDAPASVVRLQGLIASADAVLIASPEYAHGVSGVMKNALDWLVSSGVLVGKPVVLWNASPRASHALAALRETLTVMSAKLIDGAELELLILSEPPGEAAKNPNPTTMSHALLALKAELSTSSN
jgi:chromate reductase